MRILIIGILLCISSLANGDSPWGDERFFELRSSLHRRTNGVLLVAKATHVENQPETIRVSWEMDYNGARSPLSILSPSISLATFGQTAVLVYVNGKECRLASHTIPGVYNPGRDWYLTVPKGEKVRGDILVSVPQVKSYYLKNWPEDFDREKPPDIYIQLEHRPTDRGESFSLDAWTGDLHSPVIKFKLNKW